jgi:hypothetical protein
MLIHGVGISVQIEAAAKRLRMFRRVGKLAITDIKF